MRREAKSPDDAISTSNNEIKLTIWESDHRYPPPSKRFLISTAAKVKFKQLNRKSRSAATRNYILSRNEHKHLPLIGRPHAPRIVHHRSEPLPIKRASKVGLSEKAHSQAGFEPKALCYSPEVLPAQLITSASFNK